MAKRRRGRPRKASLAGTHLHQDPRSGNYVWRRVDPVTGKRRKRSTGTSVLEFALRRAAQFEEEHDRRKAGLGTYRDWRKPLLPLAEAWADLQDRRAAGGKLTEATARMRRAAILRALDDLGLEVAADLDDLPRLAARLDALRLSASAARRGYQKPLKLFTKWLAGNQRHLPRDPLASWEPLEVAAGEGPRSLDPLELALALKAAEVLDQVHGRKATRPTWLALLVTGARSGALRERETSDLLLEALPSRIDLGEGRGRKRRGVGALDKATAEELEASACRRKGPLLLSPQGARWRRERLLKVWRECFSLGTLCALWPAEQPASLDLALQVNAVLLGHRVPNKGGNPKRVTKATREKRAARRELVEAIASELREEWTRRMDRVEVRSFRTTHRTWAEAAGVEAVLIDLQLGHLEPPRESIEHLRAAASSRTGRRFYRDRKSPLFEVVRSAEAVRALLAEAEASLTKPTTPLPGAVVPLLVPRPDRSAKQA